MKQLVLVAMLAALSSSALTLLGVHLLPPAPPEEGRPAIAMGSEAGLADVVKELAALRRDLAEALRNASAPSSSGASPGPASSSRGAAERVAEPATSTQGAMAPETVQPPVRNARIAEVFETVPGTDGGLRLLESVRGRWMLRSERELIDWFGPPDGVYVEDLGVERWTFRYPKEAGIVTKVSIDVKVHDGRVIDIW